MLPAARRPGRPRGAEQRARGRPAPSRRRRAPLTSPELLASSRACPRDARRSPTQPPAEASDSPEACPLRKRVIPSDDNAQWIMPQAGAPLTGPVGRLDVPAQLGRQREQQRLLACTTSSTSRSRARPSQSSTPRTRILRHRRPGGHPDRADPREPSRLDLAGLVHQVGRAGAASKATSTRRTELEEFARADHDHQIATRAAISLTATCRFGRGIADVVAGRVHAACGNRLPQPAAPWPWSRPPTAWSGTARPPARVAHRDRVARRRGRRPA